MQEYIEIIKKRRSYYNLSEDVDLSNEEIKYLIEDVLNITPSHMNSQTTRVLLLFDDKSKDFWKRVNETFDNKIKEEKFHGFYHAKGTALIFIDKDEIKAQEKDIPSYKEHFETWGHHSASFFSNPYEGECAPTTISRPTFSLMFLLAFSAIPSAAPSKNILQFVSSL